MLKDEKERGITIKSAPITLNLQVKQSVMNDQNDSESKPARKDDKEADVYIGNLPTRGFSKEDLHSFLVDNSVASAKVIHFNGKRGFAILENAEKLLSLKPSVHGRPLVVQRSGVDAMSSLTSKCQAKGIVMPTVTTLNVGDDYQHTGVATWPAMGGVVIQAPSKYNTKKEARQAVAQECLHFLRQQENDHVVSREARAEPADQPREAMPQNESDDNGMVPLVVNLIDSPGHIEFNAEVTAALRVSDGALVVVDAIEGKAVQTEGVLGQALREGVVPVLMINKVDRLIIDQRKNPEEVYERMQRVVDDVNEFIATHQLEQYPDQRVSFAEGTVCFGSGYFGWSCSIDSFLPLFQAEDASEKAKQAFRRSLAKPENFIKHIVRPIVRMHRACGVLSSSAEESLIMSETVSKVSKILSKVPGISRIRLFGTDEDVSTVGPRKLLKKAMMTWLPAADALVEMIAKYVPSPVQAQSLRAPLLYSGDIGDACGQGMLNCDQSAPALVYIVKIMSPSPRGKQLAFGRVFSGTIRTSDVVRALKTDGTESEAKITRILICGIGGQMHSVASAQAGQLIALEGVDQALNKAGTLTSAADGRAINYMNMAVTPILQYSVQPKDKKDLTKMVSALHQIANADSTALFFRDEETKQLILACTGELHQEVLVSTLFQNSRIEVELSQPIVAYRESVQCASDIALAKSGNKHNRIFIRASPLGDDIIEAMSSGELTNLNSKALGKGLVDRYGWSASEAARIWAVGPECLQHGDGSSDADQPTCLLVDSTFGLQIPQDARENIIASFQQVVRHGVLVHSPMRGVRFDLVDAKFHADSVHRRPNSVVPAASRAMKGAFLLATPRLVEPIYKADITGAAGSLNSVYSVLGQRGGVVVDTTSTQTIDTIAALLSVRCAFGLADVLRRTTKGRVHCSLTYNGMSLVPENEEQSVIALARKQKCLGDKLPTPDAYIDKL